MNHLTDITYTDEEILELSQTQTYLFEILVRKYEEPFLRKAQSILHDKEIATDVVQDTFVKIFLQAKSFTKREGAQFSSWAYKILINTSLTAYAKQKKNWRTEASLDAKLLAVLENTQHKDVFSLIFDKDEVLSYISKLPEIFQEVTKKFYVAGKSHKQISYEEQLSESAVRTRLSRARKEMKKIYKEKNNI